MLPSNKWRYWNVFSLSDRVCHSQETMLQVACQMVICHLLLEITIVAHWLIYVFLPWTSYRPLPNSWTNYGQGEATRRRSRYGRRARSAIWPRTPLFLRSSHVQVLWTDNAWQQPKGKCDTQPTMSATNLATFDCIGDIGLQTSK